MTDRIKRFWLGVGALAVLITLLAVVNSLKNSKPVMDLSARLESQRGGTATLENYFNSKNEPENKAVLIHFWASWCPPCLGEIQEFLEFARKSPQKGLKFVIISSDKNWQELEKVVSKEKLPSNVLSLLDADSKVAESFGTFQFPETYLLTPDGKVVEKWVGPQKWGALDLNNFVGLLGK